MPEQSRGSLAAAQLEQTVNEILSLTRQLPSELITWKPEPEVWSVMQILCHIREFVPYWTSETLRIVRRPGESWGRDHTDGARLAAVTNTAAYRLEDVLADLGAAVQQAASTLKELTEAELSTEAMSKNPRWGVKPASFVVDHLLVEHMQKHLGQIRRNIAQFAEQRARVQ